MGKKEEKMKRKCAAFLITAVLLGLTACGGAGSDTSADTNAGDTASSETSEADTSDAGAGQESQAETGDAQEEQSAAEDTGEFNDDWVAASQEAQPVQMGEQVIEDKLIAFSVEKTYWADKVVPAEPAGSYNYVEPEDGNSFLICEGAVQNLTSEEVELSSSMGPLWGSVATVFIFDDTEAYYDDWYAGADSITFSLEPGEEDTLYIAVAVPDEMKESSKKVQILTGFSDLIEQAGTPMGTETGVNWPALPHKYLIDVTLP